MGDGVTCEDQDECTLDTDNCNVNAKCTNTEGSYDCHCNKGYQGDGISCNGKLLGFTFMSLMSGHGDQYTNE